jgi:hypothetical protein
MKAVRGSMRPGACGLVRSGVLIGGALKGLLSLVAIELRSPGSRVPARRFVHYPDRSAVTARCTCVAALFTQIAATLTHWGQRL